MKTRIKRHQVFFFYVLAFLISWSSWLIMGRMVRARPEPGGAVLLFSSIGGLGPLLSLVLIERLTDQEVVVKDILSQIRVKKAGMRWVLAAALVQPAITLLSQVFAYLIGESDRIQLLNPEVAHLGLFLVPVIALHFVASLVTSPLFEEPGWRGFALVRLQTRYGRWVGSLIVGVMWWIWHQPMNIPFGIMPSLYSFARMLTFSLFIDSLFNLSGQNLFIAMLAHQSYGTIFTFLKQGASGFQLVCMVLVVVGLRVLERTRSIA